MILAWVSRYKVLVFVFAILLIAEVGLWLAIIPGSQATEPAFYFLSVGQGDSELIIFPAGGGRAGTIKMLIDGGPTAAVLDGLAEVLPATDRNIDIVMLTHPHLDHFGGLIDVLNNYHVGVFVGGGRKADVESYRELHDELVAHQVPYIQVGEGDALRIGEYRFDVLAPNPQELLASDFNDVSVVGLLTAPKFKMLYTGDIGADIEERLVREYDVNVDVLKVGHHGSRFSSSDAFLREVSPAISIVEVGKNTYGHPAPAALERLLKYSSQIFRTDQQGMMKIVFENGKLQVLKVH